MTGSEITAPMDCCTGAGIAQQYMLYGHVSKSGMIVRYGSAAAGQQLHSLIYRSQHLIDKADLRAL